MAPELVGAFIAMVVPLFFSSGMILARVGLVNVPPATGNFVSLITGSVVVAVVALSLFPREVFTLPLAAYLWFVLLGVINFPVGRLLNFVSLAKLGISRATPVMSTGPLFSALIAITFLDESMTVPIGVGTLLTMAGVALAVGGGLPSRGPQEVAAPIPSAPGGSIATALGFFIRRPLLVGYLSALAAAIAYGVVPALGKVVVVNYANPIVTTAATFLFGSMIMGAAVSHRLRRDIISSDRRSLLLVSGGGVLMSTGVVLLYAALERAPVIVVSPIFSMNALVSIFMAHVFLQRIEKITRLLVFGTVLVVAGIVTITIGVNV